MGQTRPMTRVQITLGSAEGEQGPSPRKFVEARDGSGQHCRDPTERIGNAWSELYRRCIQRVGGEGYKNVSLTRESLVSVDEVLEAQFLGQLRHRDHLLQRLHRCHPYAKPDHQVVKHSGSFS